MRREESSIQTPFKTVSQDPSRDPSAPVFRAASSRGDGGGPASKQAHATAVPGGPAADHPAARGDKEIRQIIARAAVCGRCNLIAAESPPAEGKATDEEEKEEEEEEEGE